MRPYNVLVIFRNDSGHAAHSVEYIKEITVQEWPEELHRHNHIVNVIKIYKPINYKNDKKTGAGRNK